jgi:hypothetical protein
MSPSVYGAEGAMLDLADTYLAPGTYSTLRAGLFGYLTGAMSRGTGEGAYHRNVLWREQFLNTASLPNSIFNFAKVYSYTPGLANPSQCNVLLGFYLDDLQTAMGAAAGTFIIPRGQTVYLGSVPFVVAGQILLQILSNGAVTASYDLSNMDFPASPQPLYVRTYTLPQPTPAGGTRMAVYLEVRICQAQAQVTQFQVVSSSALETLYYQAAVPTGQQVAAFSVKYLPAGTTVWQDLPAIFDEAAAPTTPQYCYYDFSNDTTLEIYFSPIASSFRPAYNSQLRVTMMVTQGSAGNFDFSGAVTATLPTPYQTLAVLTELVTQPSGGTDQETLLITKQNILAKVLQRNSIVDESDLTSYLTRTVAQTSVNGSQVTFVKRRDDVIQRLFCAYLTMFDSAGRTVPTNSVPLDLEIDDLDECGWSLRPGTLVLYDRPTGIFRLLTLGEYPDQLVADPSNFVYAIPYLMVFQLSPVPRLVYYNTDADVDLPLTAGGGDVVVTDNFLASSLTVQRNSAINDAYQVNISITSNLSTSALSQLCLGLLRIIGPSGEEIGVAPMVWVQGTMILQASLTTEDTFDDTGDLLLVNCLQDSTGATIAAAPLLQGSTMTAELYYNSNSPNTTVRNVQKDGTVYQLVQTFSTTDPVPLYASLENTVNGAMYVTTAGTFHCDAVPLVGAAYFLNPRLGSQVTAIAGAYQSAVEDAFALLHNNTDVDIKFANTYGPSEYYSVDRVNISLDLEVNAVAGQATPALAAQIGAAVAAFVVTTNQNPSGRFSVSNLVTHLETTISAIVYVGSVRVNGVATKSVQRILPDATIQLNNKRVLEFLNVTTVLTNNLTADPYAPDVNVTFI